MGFKIGNLAYVSWPANLLLNLFFDCIERKYDKGALHAVLETQML